MNRHLLACILFTAGLTSAAAETFITNLGNASAGFFGIARNSDGDYRTAQSFTTGSAVTLDSVSLIVGQTSPFSDGGFHVAIYNDAAGSPGTSVASLVGDSNPHGGVSVYTTAAAVPLANGITYWVVAYVDSPHNWSKYATFNTFDTSLTHETDWSLGELSSYSDFYGWVNSSGARGQLALVATAVPEPGEYAALTGLALAGFALWRRRSAK